jgi:hypothetical protein
MTKRRLFLTVGAVAFLVVFLSCCGLNALIVRLLIGPNDCGSPKLAEEWKAKLTPLADPKSAKAKDNDIQTKRFDNGEWVFGLDRDSHALIPSGGGTVVVKDSRGSIRAFFGHVCGQGASSIYMHEAKSLDEFYKKLLDCGFQEHQWR